MSTLERAPRTPCKDLNSHRNYYYILDTRNNSNMTPKFQRKFN